MMKNVVIGSFVGFVLAAAFLAACGGSSPDANPPAVIAAGAVTWTGLGLRTQMASGVDLRSNEIWGGTASVDNGRAGTRNQLAVFDIRANVSLPSSGSATLNVGILPAVDDENWATDPQWVGTVTLRGGQNRRAALYGVTIPPMPFRLALVTTSGSVRILQIYQRPYNEELP